MVAWSRRLDTLQLLHRRGDVQRVDRRAGPDLELPDVGLEAGRQSDRPAVARHHLIVDQPVGRRRRGTGPSRWSASPRCRSCNSSSGRRPSRSRKRRSSPGRGTGTPSTSTHRHQIVRWRVPALDVTGIVDEQEHLARPEVDVDIGTVSKSVNSVSATLSRTGRGRMPCCGTDRLTGPCAAPGSRSGSAPHRRYCGA